MLLYLRFPVLHCAPECVSVRDLALFSLHAFKGKFVTEPGFCFTSVISFFFFFFLARCSFYFFIKLHPLLKACIQIAIYNLFTGPSHFSRIRSLHLAAGSSPFPTALLFIFLFSLLLSKSHCGFPCVQAHSRVGRFPALLSPRNVLSRFAVKVYPVTVVKDVLESHQRNSRFCGAGITTALIGF